MKNKYYLQIEFRYTIRAIDEESEDQRKTKKINSDLFDLEKDCLNYGNKIIENNLWIEQYPGLVGDRLNTRFGSPLIAPQLKNGTQIFISVLKLNVLDFDGLNAELSKFNVSKITKEL
jgi:hypothetical protein